MNLLEILTLLITNFITCYLLHVVFTLLSIYVTKYINGSIQFKNTKLSNLQHRFNLCDVKYFSPVYSTIVFETLLPFGKPIIFFENTSNNEFIVLHEFAHITQKHVLKNLYYLY